MGIEPTCSAWEADVLPLNYTRIALDYTPHSRARLAIVYSVACAKMR